MAYPLTETYGDETGNHIARLELLLHEAYHRIANSLQLASAVVGREAGALDDPVARGRLEVTRRHIEAIASVHALLSLGQSTEMVPLHDYLARLVAGLRQSVASGSGDRVVSLRCDRVAVQPELAACFGMIVNELVSNACKYAYRFDAPGEVRVRFTLSGDAFVLEVEDDGPGFDSLKEPEGSGLGTGMIRTMARRIGAELGYEHRPKGTRAILRGAVPLVHARNAAPNRVRSVR